MPVEVPSTLKIACNEGLVPMKNLSGACDTRLSSIHWSQSPTLRWHCWGIHLSNCHKAHERHQNDQQPHTPSNLRRNQLWYHYNRPLHSWSSTPPCMLSSYLKNAHRSTQSPTRTFVFQEEVQASGRPSYSWMLSCKLSSISFWDNWR